MELLIESADALVENFDDVLEETIKAVLPDRIKTYLSRKSNRNLMLEKYGDKAFLIPDKLKFPVVDPKSGKPHCGLIYAARIRAKQFASRKPGYREIANKAEELYKENKCSTKVHVQLREGEHIELMEFLEIM